MCYRCWDLPGRPCRERRLHASPEDDAVARPKVCINLGKDLTLQTAQTALTALTAPRRGRRGAVLPGRRTEAGAANLHLPGRLHQPIRHDLRDIADRQTLGAQGALQHDLAEGRRRRLPGPSRPPATVQHLHLGRAPRCAPLPSGGGGGECYLPEQPCNRATAARRWRLGPSSMPTS
jgi:hypothetical protein